jgi:hypothetical protein
MPTTVVKRTVFFCGMGLFVPSIHRGPRLLLRTESICKAISWGFTADSSANGHGFLLKNGRFTTIDVPGAAAAAGGTSAGGINPQGDIVGYYLGGDTLIHGFLLKK